MNWKLQKMSINPWETKRSRVEMHKEISSPEIGTVLSSHQQFVCPSRFRIEEENLITAEKKNRQGSPAKTSSAPGVLHGRCLTGTSRMAGSAIRLVETAFKSNRSEK